MDGDVQGYAHYALLGIPQVTCSGEIWLEWVKIVLQSGLEAVSNRLHTSRKRWIANPVRNMNYLVLYIFRCSCWRRRGVIVYTLTSNKLKRRFIRIKWYDMME